MHKHESHLRALVAEDNFGDLSLRIALDGPGKVISDSCRKIRRGYNRPLKIFVLNIAIIVGSRPSFFVVGEAEPDLQ